MNTPIATSEASARPSIGRPAASPNAPTKKRIVIEHRRQGTVLKAKVREALTRAMDDAKGQLEAASGTDFSYTFFVRRALDLYMAKFATLNPEQIASEAATLKSRYR